MSAQRIQQVRREFWGLRDRGVSPVVAVEMVCRGFGGPGATPRSIAVVCDLAPSFIDEHWPSAAPSPFIRAYWDLVEASGMTDEAFGEFCEGKS